MLGKRPGAICELVSCGHDVIGYHGEMILDRLKELSRLNNVARSKIRKLSNSPISPKVKKKITQNFSRAAKTYNVQAQMQKKIGLKLINLIISHIDEKYSSSISQILDVGCGAGEMTKLLNDRFKPTSLLAIDIAEAMISQAQKHHLGRGGAKIDYRVMCALDIDKLPQSSFELIYSNLCLQWVNPILEFITKAYHLLKPGGVLAISVMLHETFKEWYQLIELVTEKKTTSWLPTLGLFKITINRVNQDLKASKVRDNNELKAIYIDSQTELEHYQSLNEFKIKQHLTGALNPFVEEIRLSKSHLNKIKFKWENGFTLSNKIGYFILQKDW